MTHHLAAEARPVDVSVAARAHGRCSLLILAAGAQAVQYSRPRLSEHLASTSLTRVAISTAEAEAADQLATWTVATLCRSLSLPNILTVLTGARGLACACCLQLQPVGMLRRIATKLNRKMHGGR